jgi:hypothetical protein
MSESSSVRRGFGALNLLLWTTYLAGCLSGGKAMVDQGFSFGLWMRITFWPVFIAWREVPAYFDALSKVGG